MVEQILGQGAVLGWPFLFPGRVASIVSLTHSFPSVFFFLCGFTVKYASGVLSQVSLLSHSLSLSLSLPSLSMVHSPYLWIGPCLAFLLLARARSFLKLRFSSFLPQAAPPKPVWEQVVRQACVTILRYRSIDLPVSSSPLYALSLF